MTSVANQVWQKQLKPQNAFAQLVYNYIRCGFDIAIYISKIEENWKS